MPSIEFGEHVDAGARVALEDVELLMNPEARGERMGGGGGVIGHNHPLGARARVMAELGAGRRIRDRRTGRLVPRNEGGAAQSDRGIAGVDTSFTRWDVTAEDTEGN